MNNVSRKDLLRWLIVALAGALVGLYVSGFFPGMCASLSNGPRYAIFGVCGALAAILYFMFVSRLLTGKPVGVLAQDSYLSFLPALSLLTIPLFIPRFSTSLRTYFLCYMEKLGPKAFLFALIFGAHAFIIVASNPRLLKRMDAFVERNERRLLTAIVLIYIVFFLCTGLWDYYIFGNWHDLSRFTTAQYSVSQGHFFLSRLHTQSGNQIYELVGDHFAPIKLIILPFFLIFRTAAVFIVFRIIVMGCAAIPFFFLARLRLSSLESIVLSVAYLLIPTAMAQNYGGFHPVLLATFLVPLVIYFFETRRFGWFMTLMVLCNGMKENVPFIMLLFPVFAVLQRRSRKWILLPAAVNVLWLIVVFLILFPLFRPPDNTMVVKYPYVKSISSLAVVLLDKPHILIGNLLQFQRQEFAFYLLAPFLFMLPFGSLYCLMGLLPALVVVGLVNWPVPITFHHGILPSAFLGPASLFTISRLAGRRRVLLIAISILLLVVAISYTPMWWGTAKMHKDTYFEAQKKALKMVPPKVPVAAFRYMLPHLASSNDVYFLRESALEPGGVEYAIVNVERITSSWEATVAEKVRKTGRIRGFDLVWREGPVYVFRRHHAAAEGLK
ncbi:MAG TPA: DUF2079 domain-containing protein [bacterium]|nr:DUF2079 domain-containing protein [bacterium]